MRWNVPLGLLGAAAVAGALLPSTLAGPAWARTAAPSAADPGHGGYGVSGVLQSPPRPPSGPPGEPVGYQAPTALTAHLKAPLRGAATAPAVAKQWGASGPANTLVLYDTTGPFGWLGELYAIGAGNLATHFGKVTAEPVADYVPGQLAGYTAAIYLGSTYNEPVPLAFLNDVLTGVRPVIWAGDNVWQLSGAPGSAAASAFAASYGWDPSTSYFDTSDPISTVSYQGQSFTRSLGNAAGILAPHLTANPASLASTPAVLAEANCPGSCAPIAQTTGSSFPWAVSSRNLTYVGEIPFSFMSLTDRYVAFASLLFAVLDPAATQSHLALVRLEDVSPHSDPVKLTQDVNYLKSAGVPFSVAVIPQYQDPNGYYTNGVPVLQTLPLSLPLAAALRTAVADGGTLIQHGYTHQYSNVPNPFTAATGDDFEFYRAQCSTTPTPPYAIVTPCTNSDYVVQTGPLPGDSQVATTSRVLAGQSAFALSLLPTPHIWTTPQYTASAADYAGIDSLYQTRYESELFFGGQLSGAPIDYSHVFGQFFPYKVHDLYGSTIVPENMGDYEPAQLNNNPPRLVPDLLNEARLNTVLTQGVASFYVHPDDDPLTVLQQLVTEIKSLGYTFVSPDSLLAANG